MALLDFNARKKKAEAPGGAVFGGFVEGFSIEVMPRTAEKVADFRTLLPAGTRVYVAHIEGTPIDDMVATAKRLRDEGYPVMPHFPARIIADTAMLEEWIKRYQGEAGIDQALLLAGGVANPVGDFHCSMQLLETGLFDKYNFKNLHVAGHPEGNKDIDADGGTKLVDEAVQWKQSFAERTDADMAMATQFAFESGPVIEWADRLQKMGVTLPIHVGVAGPAKLQTLIKFAMACGVGPSLRVLTRRAKDVTKLLLPFEPTAVLNEFATHKAANPDSLISQVHFFPLGGIKTNANFVLENTELKAISG